MSLEPRIRPVGTSLHSSIHPTILSSLQVEGKDADAIKSSDFI